MSNLDVQPEITGEVIALLREVQRRGLQPNDAQEVFRPLRMRWPDLGIELLWQQEPFDHSFHFDVLIREPGGETLSVSLCADRQLPWPLRGAQRWSEFALVSINGRPVNANEAFGWLDFLWDDTRAVRHIVHTRLIQDELDLRPVEVDTRQTQLTMDRLRRTRGLLTAGATRAWLEQQGLQPEDLEHWARKVAATSGLRQRVADARGGVDRYFEATRPDWDRLLMLRLRLTDAGDRDAVAAALGASEDRPGTAMILAAEGRVAGVELAWRRRRACPLPPIGELTVARDEGRTMIECLLRVAPARLDAETREEVLAAMFAEWLDEQRRQARIEWHWGRARLLNGKITTASPP